MKADGPGTGQIRQGRKNGAENAGIQDVRPNGLTDMSVFDLIVLVILAALTLRGVFKGMISQIVSVGSYLVCWIVASRFAFVIAPSIPAEEPWNQVGAMVVLFLLTMIAIRFVHGILENWIKNLRLDKFNRLLGGVLGFAKGLLVCMVLTFFGVMLSETTRSIVCASKSGDRLARLIEKTEAFIPPESCQMLREQLDRFHAQIAGTSLETAGAEHSTGGAAWSDLISRGTDWLKETRDLQSDVKSETRGAASLLDGLARWWSGDKTSSEPTPEDAETGLRAASSDLAFLAENTATNTAEEKAGEKTASAASGFLQAMTQAAAPEPVSPPQSLSSTLPPSHAANPSNLYRDEALFQRAESAAVPSAIPSATPAAPSTSSEPLLSLLPSSGADAGSTSRSPIAARAMSIPRSSAPFRPRRVDSENSIRMPEQLLHSTRTNNGGVAATVFSATGNP